MKKVTLAAFAVLGVVSVGCGGSNASDVETTSATLVGGTASSLNIGFNGGADAQGVQQFDYYPLFFNASSIHPGPRICHTYVAWDLYKQADVAADANAPGGSRAAFKAWLAAAGTYDAEEAHVHCDEALVSFQAHDVDGKGKPVPGAKCPDGSSPPCDAPTSAQFKTAVEGFLGIDWAKETGFSGAFAFTPWNEPDNASGAGNGLGKPIPPEQAAQLYIDLASACATKGCAVAAGDFASNGNWWNDFEWNCANDNAANMTHKDSKGTEWCNTPSSKNSGNKRPASYLDRYKNYIARHATSLPKRFAYHGWHDANGYLDSGNQCKTYDDCVTRRLLLSLGGKWGGVEVWDTEVGASQGATISDDKQAQAAAFLLQLSTIDTRITRLYYTRLYGGGGELVSGPATSPTARPALCVLANRGSSTSGCGAFTTSISTPPPPPPAPSPSPTFASIAGAATNADGRVEVFAIGTNGTMYHKWQTSPGSGPWSDWSALDGPLLESGAGVARNSDGRLEVFAVDNSAHGMWHIWQVTPGGTWNHTPEGLLEWFWLGGSFLAGVGAATNHDGRLEVFGIGTGNQMMHAYQSTASTRAWSGWGSLGGWFSSGVGATANADGRLEVFGVGGGNAMYHAWQATPGGSWSETTGGSVNWSSLGGGFVAGAGATANSDGRLEAFGIGSGGTTYHDWQSTAGGGWSAGGWSPLAGTTASASPSVSGATTNTDGRVEVFIVGSDSRVYHDWQTTAGTGSWSGWNAL